MEYLNNMFIIKLEVRCKVKVALLGCVIVHCQTLPNNTGEIKPCVKLQCTIKQTFNSTDHKLESQF